MIRKLFIANRGEIALRVVRAAKKLGIHSVLAVSTADRESMAAKEADQVVVVGPAPARSSYLNGPALVHAAVTTGCDALHPGYGFLSERASFAKLCEDQGILFVGPRSETIEAVGDKLAARRLATTAGIPMVSGTGKVSSTEEALSTAERIGYPVITKASAGGGGRGMRVARNASELRDSFDRSSQEALEAFGDGTLYLERFVERARHIEVQVLGDGHGEVLHFGERDCTLQRRYQKMMEEAPAIALSEGARQRIHAAAIGLLKPLKYRNAGTVEFLFDPDRDEFYFMEVNARIQVEHPVSEMICGVDLIELQLQVAALEKLPLQQSDIRFNGHAVELRILAEDPRRDFQPSPGRLTEWHFDTNSDGRRLDSAMHVGALVPPYYDSMIGKLLVHCNNRDETMRTMLSVVQGARIAGIRSNVELLRFLLAHPDVLKNDVDTRWAERVLMPQFLQAQ
ncbi:acetyl/propionyl/methylcrotonyl-CoA carboxylase subunit alpha [Acidovorax sp. MR-S7]|uniref:acetyl-CoA carboxylase biotin carboxylase subunit n=1 Tax=Acidovorax sp. MR-S7 TaxID=1268622 RepID=UPI0003D40258|nr:biotin carboxylase N-terminal domain-containing protein [Acidovorax sp. MR-S7]GAD21155.1 biotin carboxylase [Acidovorax sp. MR-S7]